MLLTKVFGNSNDPERRLKALTVTSLTGAIGVLVLLAVTLYLVFSEVVDNNARSSALENATNLASSSTSQSERINFVSSDVDALDHDVDDLKFDSNTLEDRLRDLQRELDVLHDDFRDLKQRFDQGR